MRKSQTQLPDSPIKLREQCLSEWKKGLDRAKYKARQLVLPSPGLIQSLAGLSGPGSYTAPAAEARGCNENWSQESMWGIGLTTQYESCFIPSHQQRDCALHKNLSPTLRNSSSPTLHGSPLLPQRANTSSTRPPARLSALIPSDFLPCGHTLGLNPDTKMPPSHSHYLNASGFF